MKKIFISLSTLIIISTIIIAINVGYVVCGVFTSNSDKALEGVFVIEEGSGVNTISDNLYNQGFINSKWNFEWYAWFIGENKFIAGEHILNKNMNIVQVATILTSNPKPLNEKKIKLLEGWNNREMGYYFENQGMFQSEEFMEVAGFSNGDYSKEMALPMDFSDEYEFLKGGSPGVEGYIFPDTYKIYKNASVEDIVRKALNNFDKKITPKMREDIKAQGKTIHEIVTLASIIEKETLTHSEKPIVASVFYNRLEIGMALQSDVTVNYVTGNYNRQPSYAELKVESPYNTYLHKGLPPGPVANPGAEAIKAAIYPAESDYLYFLHKKNGEAVFSRTYNQHIASKHKWLD